VQVAASSALCLPISLNGWRRTADASAPLKLLKCWDRITMRPQSAAGSTNSTCCLTTLHGCITATYVVCRPRRPDAAVIVGAQQDAYVSPESILELQQHLTGSEVRWGGTIASSDRRVRPVRLCC
jgi:hypothetical protein